MAIGIGSYAFTWAVGVPGSVPDCPLDHTGLLERARDLGVGLVQFCDNLPLHVLSRPAAQELRVRARGESVAIQVGARGLDPGHLRAYLGLAEFYGSPLLRVVADSPERRYTIDEVRAAIEAVIGDFERAEIRLAIENHDRFTSSQLAGLVGEFGVSRVAICLDTVNSFGALEGPGVVIDTLLPLAANLHVKDFAVFRPPHQMGFTVEGRPAGQGRLDIPALLRRAAALSPVPDAVIELWTPPAASAAETIAREREWAMRSVRYMKACEETTALHTTKENV